MTTVVVTVSIDIDDADETPGDAERKAVAVVNAALNAAGISATSSAMYGMSKNTIARQG